MHLICSGRKFAIAAYPVNLNSHRTVTLIWSRGFGVYNGGRIRSREERDFCIVVNVGKIGRVHLIIHNPCGASHCLYRGSS